MSLATRPAQKVLMQRAAEYLPPPPGYRLLATHPKADTGPASLYLIASRPITYPYRAGPCSRFAISPLLSACPRR